MLAHSFCLLSNSKRTTWNPMLTLTFYTSGWLIHWRSGFNCHRFTCKNFKLLLRALQQMIHVCTPTKWRNAMRHDGKYEKKVLLIGRQSPNRNNKYLTEEVFTYRQVLNFRVFTSFPSDCDRTCRNNGIFLVFLVFWLELLMAEGISVQVLLFFSWKEATIRPTDCERISVDSTCMRIRQSRYFVVFSLQRRNLNKNTCQQLTKLARFLHSLILKQTIKQYKSESASDSNRLWVGVRLP